jgi:hypothetical protein
MDIKIELLQRLGATVGYSNDVAAKLNRAANVIERATVFIEGMK